MKSYPLELRQQVIAACDAGLPTELVAQHFAVSPAWVRRLKQHRRERGDIAPRTAGGSRGHKIDRNRLAQLVAEQPNATLSQLRDGLGITVTPWAISKALRTLQNRAPQNGTPSVSEGEGTWQTPTASRAGEHVL